MARQVALSRWLPQPLLSLTLWLLWLMLNQSLSIGQVLLGAVLALFLPWFLRPLMGPPPCVARPLVLLRYLLRLATDILISNFQVARRVLGPASQIRPGFVAYPLEVTHDLPITILASTVALTPGTLSADVSPDRCWLYIHVLTLDDETVLIDTIKTRYEALLKEIFPC